MDPHSGRVVNTPEVEHAAQVHLAIHAKEASRNGYGYEQGYEHETAPVHYLSEGEHVDYVHSPVFTYHGPYAHLEFDHEGRPLDTPEVKHFLFSFNFRKIININFFFLYFQSTL